MAETDDTAGRHASAPSNPPSVPTTPVTTGAGMNAAAPTGGTTPGPTGI
jgi:hypothetical protein